jgi:hypothetical protein
MVNLNVAFRKIKHVNFRLYREKKCETGVIYASIGKIEFLAITRKFY